MNKMTKIFNLMDIDTQMILETAGTKWNYLPFNPGLAGGRYYCSRFILFGSKKSGNGLSSGEHFGWKTFIRQNGYM